MAKLIAVACSSSGRALGARHRGRRAPPRARARPVRLLPLQWPFAALRAASLLQLDLHVALLEHGFSLSDASAYSSCWNGSNCSSYICCSGHCCRFCGGPCYN